MKIISNMYIEQWPPEDFCQKNFFKYAAIFANDLIICNQKGRYQDSDPSSFSSYDPKSLNSNFQTMTADLCMPYATLVHKEEIGNFIHETTKTTEFSYEGLSARKTTN